MLILITIYVTLITQTYSLHTEHFHNKVVRRKTEYRVNISMPDNDIEMVDLNEQSQINDTGYKFNKAHINTHRRIAQTRSLVTKNNRTTSHLENSKDLQNQSHIELVKSRNYRNNWLTNSSCGVPKSEENSNVTHYIVEIDDEKRNLEEQAIPPRIAREISADRIWNIIQIWLIVYFILAIPLWCTIGRCCCCLVCKCFRAQETIREAKQYAMWNPPGVLRKKTGDVIYTPSEKEKEAYEELEHLIRTL